MVDDCSKDYRRAPSHSPGLFTVQFSCSHPKLLGVTVMSANESLSTALTAVISRFPELSIYPIYNNACNLVSSVSLRLPWVQEKTLFLCDRFHFRSHKCTSVFDPEIYPDCDDIRTSGAEALNRQFSASQRPVRFLSGEILVPFVYVGSLFLIYERI